MSLTEKILFSVLVAVMVGSAATLLWQLNDSFSRPQPAAGGSFIEGVVGSPRFINPVLAASDSDRDIVSLVYSGLLKRLPNGRLALDLAEDISVSEEATVFTVTLKEEAVFHDGEPVTAEDVAFTVEHIKNPEVRSPARGDWSEVKVEVLDERRIEFELTEPYSPFLDNLTVGILPAHLWSDIRPSQFPSSPHNDATPVGSGPYQVTDFARHPETGLMEYQLTSFTDYIFGEPYISSLTIRSFANEENRIQALQSGEIDSAGGLDPAAAEALAESDRRIQTAYLPRVFGVFFNPKQQEILESRDLRAALNAAVDREVINQEVLKGYGAPSHSPAPAGWIPGTPADLDPKAGATTSTSSPKRPRELLNEAGWSRENGQEVLTNEDGEELSFTLSTSNAPELARSAELLQDQWQELGAEVSLELYSTGDLNREVIRGRDYQSLLFGMMVGGERDFYPFWHSSQRSDPGLNIALYDDPETDELLEETRQTADPRTRNTLIGEFLETAAADQAAIFLYTPEYIYVPPAKAQNADIGPLNTARNRFSLIHQWHLRTKRTWIPFLQDTDEREPAALDL